MTLVTVDLEEHYENIKQAKERLRNLPASQSGEAPDIPDIPLAAALPAESVAEPTADDLHAGGAQASE